MTDLAASIASTILVLGIGGATLHQGKAGFEISPMALAAVAGILLNAALPKRPPETPAAH